MESLTSTFLLFIAAIVALLSYMIIPRIPVIALMTVAAIALAAGVWWHWTQFAVDYRTSTWQEMLRGYASYALLLVVILLSYAFYVFGWKDSSFSELATRGVAAARNAGRRATSQVIGSATRGLSAASSALLSEGDAAPAPAPAFSSVGFSSGRGSSNILA
jgi:hypothetical protein